MPAVITNSDNTPNVLVEQRKNNEESEDTYINRLSRLKPSKKWSIIPTVHAKPKETCPQRPPPMRYKDLPIYKSPHNEYKEYLADQEKCPCLKKKIFHSYFLPIVKSNRQNITKKSCEFYKDYCELRNDFVGFLRKKKDGFIKEMRDPQNLPLRQATVLAGGAYGYYYGRKSIGLSKPLFFASLGVLATGALCFPKETDVAFRNFTYHTAQTALTLYNKYCKRNFQMRQQIPCKEDMPPPPPPRLKKNKCDKPK